MNTIKHSLFSHDSDAFVAWFDKFDGEQIKKAIVKHLSEHKLDVLEHCKDYNARDVKRYYGVEIVNIYQCNKDGIPCRVVTKGNKDYFKPINI